jgi:malonate-semialdehyde dehydrogenase (acetylating)/methylmalonate-semialdehyde dehydrogenase
MLSNIGKRTFSTKVYKNKLNGEWVASAGTQRFDIICPATQNLLAQVPQSTEAEFSAIVSNAKDTFKEWKEVPIS